MTVPSCQPSCAPDGEPCHLCRDDAVEAGVVALADDGRSAIVSVEGKQAMIALDLVSGIGPGDRVLVHQGFAISRLEEAR